MADHVTFEVEIDGVIRAFRALPDRLEPKLDRLAEAAAERVANDARSRLDRALGEGATGKTREGIAVERARNGRGYVVVARRNPYPSLPNWLDKGTQHMAARPFFDVAARLEAETYRRQVLQVIRDEADEIGLGE